MSSDNDELAVDFCEQLSDVLDIVVHVSPEQLPIAKVIALIDDLEEIKEYYSIMAAEELKF